MIAPSEVPHAGPCHQGFGILQNLRLGLSKSMAFQRNEIQIGPWHEQGRMLEESTLPVFRWLVTPATDFWQNWVHSQMEVPPKPTGLPENTELKLPLLVDKLIYLIYCIPFYPHTPILHPVNLAVPPFLTYWPCQKKRRNVALAAACCIASTPRNSPILTADLLKDSPFPMELLRITRIRSNKY